MRPAFDQANATWGAVFSAFVEWNGDEYEIQVNWGAIDGATRYRLTLNQGATQVDQVTTIGLTHTFHGLSPETDYLLTLEALDDTTVIETMTLEVLTPIGPPDSVEGIDYTAILSSLAFTWNPADNADSYTATLNGESQTVTTEAAEFSGLAPGTTYTLEVYASNGVGDGPTTTVQATTLALGAPANIQHTATTDSLAFTWDAVSGADGYRATLDGVEQDVAATEAAFTGLEDGTEFTLTLRAYIATGEGDAATYQVTTQYLTPAPPENVQWGPPRALGIITSWEVPEKVTFLQSAILLQGRPVAAEILDHTETSRDWWLPYAGREFTWRIRTGNPGGYSDWVETTVYTTDIFVDSRAAVLGAAYQEDYLFPDIWDGGTDQQGAGDPQNVLGGPVITEANYRLDNNTETKKLLIQGGLDDYSLNKRLYVYDHEDRSENKMQVYGRLNDYVLFQYWPYIDIYPQLGSNRVLIYGGIVDYSLRRALFVYEDCCNLNKVMIAGALENYILEKP
jgi:hypothetical protein